MTTMLYRYSYLRNLNMDDTQIPLSRYLFKFQQNEIKRIKAHEKDFLFKNMYILRDETNKKCFDLSTINEASDYYFNRLILLYSENLNFCNPTYDAYGALIEDHYMKKDEIWFNNKYDAWIRLLDTRIGKYLHVIYIELNRKLKESFIHYTQGEITEEEYNYHIKYLRVLSFYIYYKVKLFFNDMSDKFISLNILDKIIVINIYSFVHILFRHYMPSMDIVSTGRSINTPIPFLDIDNLPISLESLISEYFRFDRSPLNSSREYLLFSFNGDKYIIWIKYDRLEELNNNFGFEFRTLYKCQEQRDLDKFSGLSEHKVNNELSFYY